MSTPQSAIAHNASNRDIFPGRVVRAPQAEFFNSILRFRNEAGETHAAVSSVLFADNVGINGFVEGILTATL